MENNKKQTALQQFIEKICYFDYTHQKWRIRMIEDEDITSYFEEFKEIEKQQMRDFFDVGFDVGYNDDESPSFLTSEQHYNKTFE